MHIKILQSTTVRDFEQHRQRDIFQAGRSYDVEITLGALFVSEGWAEPLDTDKPARVEAAREPDHKARA